MFLVYVIAFIISCNVCLAIEREETLKLTNVLYRHGDRTPVAVIPSDENKEESWTEGLGQLTMIGVQQEYALGMFLRDRYSAFLSEDYKLNEIYVQSTDVPRTLMSAQSVLCGLYPPSPAQRWDDSIAWQPIPVHTVPTDYDHMFSVAPCDRYWEIGNATVKADTDYLSATYGKKFLQDLYTKAGYNGTVTFKDGPWWLFQLHDTLFIEKLKERSWPAWMNDSLYELIHERLIPDLAYTRLTTTEQKRLRGGALLEKMTSDMGMKRDGLMDGRKMFMYSAHDSTVAPLLRMLAQAHNFSTPYSTVLVLELHQAAVDEGGEGEEGEGAARRYYVQLWLRTDREQGLRQLNITGCSQPDCDFEEFLNATRLYRVQDRAMECRVGVFGRFSTYASYQTVFIVACVLSGLVLLMFLVLCVLCCKCTCTKCTRRRAPRKYHVHEKAIPERVPMINTGFSDED